MCPTSDYHQTHFTLSDTVYTVIDPVHWFYYDVFFRQFFSRPWTTFPPDFLRCLVGGVQVIIRLILAVVHLIVEKNRTN